MYAQVKKTKENSIPKARPESKAVANLVGQNQVNLEQKREFVDNRSQTVKQRRLQNLISFNSNALQLKQSINVIQMARSNPPKSEPLIVGEVYKIGGNSFTVKSDKKSLKSVDELLDHMAGEKPATWDGQAKGGHLKSTMDLNKSKIDNKDAKITWVKSVSSNTPHSRPKATWKWSSIDNTKETGEKMSTMWPTGWMKSDLTSVFENSYLVEEEKAGNKMYLSGQGPGVNKYFSYIHLSDGGAGTAYPETL